MDTFHQAIAEMAKRVGLDTDGGTMERRLHGCIVKAFPLRGAQGAAYPRGAFCVGPARNCYFVTPAGEGRFNFFNGVRDRSGELAMPSLMLADATPLEIAQKWRQSLAPRSRAVMMLAFGFTVRGDGG